MLDALAKAGVAFVALKENIRVEGKRDIQTKVMTTLFALFAEVERDLIGGRPPKLKPHQQQEIVTLVKQGKKTAADAARLFGVHPATVSRLLRRT